MGRCIFFFTPIFDAIEKRIGSVNGIDTAKEFVLKLDENEVLRMGPKPESGGGGMVWPSLFLLTSIVASSLFQG